MDDENKKQYPFDELQQENELEDNEIEQKPVRNQPSYYVETPKEYHRKTKRRGIFSYFVVALVAALIGGLISSYIAPMYLYGNIIPLPDIYRGYGSTGDRINITTTDDITTVTAVAKKSAKSVVGITTIEIQRDWLWGDREVQGVGSGVIVNSDGYILTNSHVVSNGNAKDISVQLENGDKKNGEVLWSDPSLDLAVVKVDGTNYPAVELGNSDNLEVGQLVVAIGNPLSLDLQRTVTSGIISGLNRTIRLDQYNSIDNLIQTDASINPGNSGGPLLNANGDVIGINTAKITSAEGLGFAIPVNVAKPIIEQVIKEGEVKAVYMGIVGVEVAEYEARLGIDLKADSGVIVIEIAPDSPAQAAGLQAGDVIQSLDGKEINSMDSLRSTLLFYKPGQEAKLKIIRNSVERELTITFVESPDNY